MGEHAVAEPRFSGVAVIPNASRVRGRVLRVSAEPGGHGSVWDIAVETAHDIEGFPNFVKDHVGKTIQVYVHPRLQSALAEKDILEARVAFREDERGGRFVLTEDQVRKV